MQSSLPRVTADASIPSPRFPGKRKGDYIAFEHVKTIHPKCGTLEDAIRSCQMPDADALVPVGYEPRRWQAVISAHNLLSRAIQMDGAGARANWSVYIRRLIKRLVSQHRARGVCIHQGEMRVLLTEIAAYLSPDIVQLDRDTLYTFCTAYSSTPPDPVPLPDNLASLHPCPMRTRRQNMCQPFKSLY